MPQYSFTECWRYHHDEIHLDFDTGKVVVSGKSGYYIPVADSTEMRQFSPSSNAIQKIIRLSKDPGRYLPILRARALLKLRRKLIDLLQLNYHVVNMDPGIAFDAVMNHHPLAEVQISPHRINFLDLQQNPAVMPSTKAVKGNYAANIGLDVTQPIILTYYDYNIIVGLTNVDSINTVLEIGAGSGNLASVIYANLKKRVVIVDLPRSLSLAITFLSSLFPEAKMVLPQEATTQLPGDADFVFLTPGQTHLIPDNSVELAINTRSFQGMTPRQIAEYFALIQRACKVDGYFYTRNRSEKLPDENIQHGTKEPVIRFSEYPWNPDNRVLAYETCQFGRLTQRDQNYVRLEQIRK